MTTKKGIAAVVCLVFALVVGTIFDASAQENPFARPEAQARRIQFTLVSAGKGMPPSIFRRATAEPRNVIMLDPAVADVQQLSDAVYSLLMLEAQDPTGGTRADNLVRRVRLPASAPVYPWAAEALARLKGAQERPVAGLGRRRTLDLWVAPQRSQAR